MFYYKFHIGDYTSHTGHLDHVEDIVYRRLLDWCYLHERPLPDDIDQIAKLIRMRSHSDCIANVLREFFVRTADGQGWWQERISVEIAAASEKSEKASQSAKARWEKEKKDANALRPQSEGNATKTQDPLPKTQQPKTKKKATDVAVILELPSWLPKETWDQFLAMRQKMRKPMTPHAQELMIKKLEQFMKKGLDIKALLENSIVNCWQDVYEPKGNSVKTRSERNAEILSGLTRGLIGGNSDVKLLG